MPIEFNAGEIMLEDVPELIKKFEFTDDIICPYCGHVQDTETMYGHVTYWGDGEAKECYCENCGKEFMVKEHVSRSFTTSKKVENDEKT